VNNNNLWPCDVDVACHKATRLTSSHNNSWLVTLTSHHWFDELISLVSWKYYCPLQLISIRSSVWLWHGMPFGNKVSQIFMAIHEFLWHHKFLCVLNLWGQYLSWHTIFFVCHEVFEVMNSHACACVLNNLLLIVIMTTTLIVILKKVTHNSLTN